MNVIVALGSNLGDSARILEAAAKSLEKFSEGPVRLSSFYRTTPIDCPPGSPDFLNAVAVFEPRPGLTPELLLKNLKGIEHGFGRKEKKIHNEPRPLDLDIIAFGDFIMNTPDLVLPHPRAHARKFVLVPLAELAPDYILPGQRLPVADLLQALES